MTPKRLVAFGLLAVLTCSCGMYFRLPKKAEPDQSIWGECHKLKTGGIRIHDEKDNFSWRAPKGYRFEETGTCVTKKRDAGKQARICTWKVRKGEASDLKSWNESR